jgi:high-affinity nickel permease
MASARSMKNFNELGFAIVAVFILAWFGSVVVYRYARIAR